MRFYGISPENASNAETVIDMHNAVKGDANEDGKVSISDAVKVLQNLADSEKYPLTAQGAYNADVNNTGDGITGLDAAEIQRLDTEVIL
ncbi:MAG: dockerin type I repeat-containing protein [Ruminococcus sp.]|nr:dockerin type I repeat-containing protein [Ruminococcus sp.]